MKAWVLLGLLFVSAGICAQREPGPSSDAQAGRSVAAPQQDLVRQYCAGCHNDRAVAGGFSFTNVDIANPSTNAALAEKIILKVRTGLMPPAGQPRPGAEALKAFASAMEDRLDQAAALNPDPGRPQLHRMNRAEYRNAVRDILGIDVNVEGLLPADSITHGFDNMAEALTITPTLMDAYVRSAGKIARLALGDPRMSPLVETYRVATNFSQIRHVEGTPFGSRGGIAVVHTFPASAEYVFRMSLVFTRNTLLFGATMEGEQLEVAVNGERVALLDIDPLMKTGENDLRTPPIAIKTGAHTVSAAFLKRADGPIEDFLRRPERSLADDFSGQIARLTNPPHLRDLGIMGPYNAAGVADTPSRRKIFSCFPSSAVEERPCAQTILSSLARQAFRKPLTPVHIDELMGAYEEGRDRGDFETGIRMAIQFILASPEFIFRIETPPGGIAPGTPYRVSNFELASRLSFFLWSSIPDEDLLAAAEQPAFQAPESLERQVHRMLQDPRADALAANFASQWLRIRSLEGANPDSYLYPDSDDNLLLSMRRETELLFGSVVRENRGIIDLLTADDTFVDERLAKHYGIPNILGNRFRRVRVTDPNRFGLLGQGSILTATSFSNRTSPVVRGKWVLEQILGISAPPPPPDVPALEENNVTGGETLKLRSVRERLEQHRSVEPCRSCHKIMDPLGFALENFDAVGAWRVKDSGFMVETSGEMVDGSMIDSPVALREALVKDYSDAIVRNFTAKLLTYGLGRGLTAADMPFVRQILRDAAPNYRFESIVMGIVTSTPFQMARAEAIALNTNNPTQ